MIRSFNNYSNTDDKDENEEEELDSDEKEDDDEGDTDPFIHLEQKEEETEKDKEASITDDLTLTFDKMFGMTKTNEVKSMIDLYHPELNTEYLDNTYWRINESQS